MDIIQSGSEGDDVKAIQNRLIQSGFKIAADGIFGNDTQAAVIQFQTQHQLIADGAVGTNTYAVLNRIPIANSSTIAHTIKGVDISHLNGLVNWAKLATEVRFVYCKASQGKGFKDDMLIKNFASAEKAGILPGAYHFLTFQHATATEQVKNFLDCGIDFSKAGLLPPVLDVEWQVPDTLNPYILNNRATCIQLVRDWLTEVATKTGRVPMIYTNRRFWHDYLGNPSGFEKYPLWLAAYQQAQPVLPPGWSKYTFWQYNGTGIDKDVFNGNMDELEKLALL